MRPHGNVACDKRVVPVLEPGSCSDKMLRLRTNRKLPLSGNYQKLERRREQPGEPASHDDPDEGLLHVQPNSR